MQEKTKIRCSVIIPVKNEEANIRVCLESVRWADEIFVVDSHSTDRTVDMAREYTDKVYQFNYTDGWPKKKNWALENLPFKHEWVLLIDADERVMPQLKEEIADVLSNSDTNDGFYINRRVIFMGKWIKHCGWYPSWNLRLFKHKLGRFERLNIDAMHVDVEVHEHVVLRGKAGYLKNDLLHEDYKSIYHFIDRQNRFTSWDAGVYNALKNNTNDNTISSSFFGDRLERKRFLKKIWVKLPFRPFLRFILMYFIRLGFLDGKPGYIFCRLFSQYEFWVSIKIYESELKNRTIK